MTDKTDQISLDAVKALLKRKNMTFEQLAERMGKERSVVYKTIANGNPTYSFISKLLEILETDFDSLRTSKMPSPSITGFIESDGRIYKIQSLDDLLYVANTIKAQYEALGLPIYQKQPGD